VTDGGVYLVDAKTRGGPLSCSPPACLGCHALELSTKSSSWALQLPTSPGTCILSKTNANKTPPLIALEIWVPVICEKDSDSLTRHHVGGNLATRWPRPT
jgi:hypothetical protein